MKELNIDVGKVRMFSPKETRIRFVPLRDHIFDVSRGGVDRDSERIFRDKSWVKVIIRGSLEDSNRSEVPRAPWTDDNQLLEWAKDDPRSELQPLLDLLVEDGIGEVIHMYPGTIDEKNDALTTRPTYYAISSRFDGSFATQLQERLLFDETGRWGFYASEEEFGLLGGEPAFMERYIERVGGMGFIREKANAYWQLVLDENGFEARSVENYYKLADWDNPPFRMGDPS